MYIKLSAFVKHYKYALLYGILTPLFCLLFIFLSRHIPGLGQWYAENIFPVFPNTLGRLFSPLPFSLFEMIIYLLVFGFVMLMLFIAESLFTESGRHRLLYLLPKGLISGLCICSSIFLMLTMTCTVNYTRDGIAKDTGIVTAPSTQEDLKSLCLLLIDDLIENPKEPLSASQLHAQTIDAMTLLGEKYPSFEGYYPNPKPVLMSSWMSDINLTGLFSPYTIEANYNRDVVDYIKPYTICHELAHLRGYIKEDEAGFIAYLACSGSNSQALRYSGALNALSYALNSLFQNSTEEEYRDILKQVPEYALDDLMANQEYWQSHRGRVSQISTAANDQYLKANAQADGVKSYGRMVDLLLAYYGLNSQSV